MVTICCTVKLLKRTGFPVSAVVDEPTTALGNWHANILFIQHTQVLLFVNDASRLGVITPARQIRSLESHLTQHLSALLAYLNVPQAWIDAEVREMAAVSFAATHSRSVLGTMNDYKYQIESMIWGNHSISPLEMAIQLSVCPVGPLQYRSPDKVSFELLKVKYDPV
jgi:hypothetical protein